MSDIVETNCSYIVRNQSFDCYQTDSEIKLGTILSSARKLQKAISKTEITKYNHKDVKDAQRNKTKVNWKFQLFLGVETFLLAFSSASDSIKT